MSVNYHGFPLPISAPVDFASVIGLSLKSNDLCALSPETRHQTTQLVTDQDSMLSKTFWVGKDLLSGKASTLSFCVRVVDTSLDDNNNEMPPVITTQLHL